MARSPAAGVSGLVAFAALALLGALTAAAGQDEAALDADELEFFEAKIRPLLVSRCFDCHGPYLNAPSSGLVLASRAGWARGGARGPAIVPGDPDASLLIRAVRYADPALAMPPGGRMSDAEIALLERWVAMGAPDPRSGAGTQVTARAPIDFEADREFWSFRPPGDAAPPEVVDEAWITNDIDRYVLARLEEEGLQPAGPADERTLLRRASLDLIGLPPTPAEVEAFLADDAPDAFERVVERLLASPHYGERWGRYWLDLARYADSNGLDENLALGNAWRYRDYVVRSFNEDKPYDVFLTEQLAGDLLPETDDLDQRFQRLTATGFLVLGPKMLAEQDKPKLLMDIVDEQIDVSLQAFAGMTVGCARCHDHKFDPLPTEDYYALAGVFKSTSTMQHLEHVAAWREVELASPEEIEALRAWTEEVSGLEERVQELREESADELYDGWLARTADYLLAARAASRAVGIVEAEDFARGNLTVDDANWGAVPAVIVHTGRPGPQFVEYDLYVPDDRPYRLDVRYAAAESRPMRVLLDGDVLFEDALGAVTGGWHPDAQTWVTLGELPAGIHTLRLERDGATPHVDKLLIAPQDWLQADLPPGLEPLLVQQWVDWLHVAGRTDDPRLRVWNELAQTPEDQLAARMLALFVGFGRDSLLESRALFDDFGPFELSEPAFETLLPAEVRAPVEAAKARLAELEENEPTDLPSALAVRDGDVQDLPVHKRGSHLSLARSAVPRGFLRITDHLVTPPEIPADTSGRLQLAQWLTDPAHPLTSRVMANRVWKGHFGNGLVRTPSNFGRRGAPPSHPELLDWLARELVAGDWSLKHMHRVIMASSAYRMSSITAPEVLRRDPGNRLLARMTRRRVEAETLRDAILFASGRLDPTLGGSLMTAANRGYVTNDQSGVAADYTAPRRSLYLPVLRNAMYELFATFDYNDPSVPVDRRPSTTVAHQALLLMNSPLLIESSRAFAREVLAVEGTDAERLEQAYLRALARPPSAAERERAFAYLDGLRADEAPRLAAAGGRTELPLDPAAELEDPELEAWQSLCQVLFASNEFLYVD